MFQLLAYHSVMIKIPEPNKNLKELPHGCQIDLDVDESRLAEYGGSIRLKIQSFCKNAFVLQKKKKKKKKKTAQRNKVPFLK